MARRSRRDDLAVSLFPFLSVLACVIGTLTLLLAAIAIGSIGGHSLDQIRLAERFEALQEFLAGARAKLVELEAQIRARQQEAAAGEALGMRLAGVGLSPDISLEELSAIVDLERRAAELQAESSRLERDGRRLAAAMAERKQRVEEREALQLRAPIIIDPTGFGRDRRPYLVECGTDYIEIHRTRGDFSFRIPREEIELGDDYKKFLRQMRVIRDGIVIFLIRPDGVSTFNQAEAIANEHRVRHAKLPLPGQGRLDLSRFGED